MIRPTSRLAAPVTGSASAPISWSSRGSERQSTERGAAAAFGNATAQRPMKSSASLTVPGSCAAAAPIRASGLAAACEARAVRPAPAIERDQARRFGVVGLDDARAPPARIQPIEKPRQQHRAGAVDAIELRQVDVDRAAPFRGLGALHCPGHRRRVSQVERAARHETRTVSFWAGSDGNAHCADFMVPW